MTTAEAHPPLPESVSRRYPHRYAVLDVETSGLRPKEHRVLQIAITQLDASGALERRWSTLVDPGVEHGADLGPVGLHGITPERLAGAPSYAQIAGTVADLVRDRVVVAHNASFDWAFLAPRKTSRHITAYARAPVHPRTHARAWDPVHRLLARSPVQPLAGAASPTARCRRRRPRARRSAPPGIAHRRPPGRRVADP